MIYRKTGSNISLESAGFAGGRFVARETSPGVSAMAAGGALATAGVEVTVSTVGAGAVVGGPAVAAGAEIAAAGAATAATGGVLVMNSSKNKNDGYERGKGNTSSGNKNMKHANKKAKDSATSKYERAKAKYDGLNNKTNKSPEDKNLLERLKREYRHWESKKNYTGENHSRNAKGNR